jgi:hypothetical protein
LLIATHCTDAPGYRCRYEFADTDGRARTPIVDETAGAEIERPGAEHVHVTVFESFVSLDGVDWADREGKAALPVGAAMTTYLELATALARAQVSVYGDNPRRPYVMVGCHFQRIRKKTREDPLPIVRRELQASCAHWRR